MVLLLAGAALRLFNLGNFPGGLFRDEAALGYNGYSVLRTGMDEYGVLFPLVFRSFEVFFLPAYVYLSAPLIGIFGLSEFSARLLSAVSGIVGLSLIWFIAREIWEDKKAAVFSVLVLAISPWHIFYSRGAFEGNLALTFFCAGFLFWLKFIKNTKSRQFFLSGFFFLLSMYSYQAERLVAPLFLLFALFFSRNLLWRLKKQLILPAIILLLFSLPLLSLSLKPGGYHRAAGVTVFSQDEYPAGWIIGEKQNFLVNNGVYLRARQFAALYFSYFSPRNLFFEGDYDKQRSVENFSVFYGWMGIFIILGAWYLWKRLDINGGLLFIWLLLGPVPAAFTGDPFHTYRSLLFYLPLSLLAGFGIAGTIAALKKYELPAITALILLSVGSLGLFAFSYFGLNQTTRAGYWDYGYREVVEYTKSLPEKTRIIVDDPKTEAYVHFLFFGKIDPEIYHKEVAKLNPPRDYYYTDNRKIRPDRLGNIEFRHVDWPTERGDKGTVFIMAAERLPESEFISDPKIELLREIYYPSRDKKIAFRIVKIKP